MAVPTADPQVDDAGQAAPVTAPAPASGFGMGPLGMAIFLFALGVLFAASLVAYLVIRERSGTWPPPNTPRLPAGLWLSTLILLACSGAIHWARRGIRTDRQSSLRTSMIITSILGLLFLASQIHNWLALAAAYRGLKTDLYAFTFYMLTGLHAAHVVGGLVFLAVVTVKAFRDRYSRDYHPGVRYCAMYWHFLDGVWLILFVTLLIGG